MSIIALNAAVTGAQATQTQIDTIANNIANVKTTGFKKSYIETSDLFYTTLKKAGVQETSDTLNRPVGVQVGMGTKVLGTHRNLTQGALTQTSQPLDVALTGAGYFAISLPGGKTGYTRNGTFSVDASSGNIVTSEGYTLSDNISIPAEIPLSTITISNSGLITASDANSTTPIQLGQLNVYGFPNEDGLEQGGDNMLLPTSASGDAYQVANVTSYFKQGWLEESNVSAVEELTNLITAQRSYELNSRVIRVADEISKEANGIK